MQLSDSEEIRTIYHKLSNSHTHSSRISNICDVISEIIVHADIKPFSVGERTIAVDNLNAFKTFMMSKKLVVYDRGYPSKELLTFLQKNQMEYLVRGQKGCNITIDITDKKDFFVTIGGCKVRLISSH